MMYLATCGLISFVTGAMGAVFVFFHKPRNSLKATWSLYSLGISLWGGGIFQFLMMDDAKVLLILSRAINLSSLFIPMFFFHFVLLLTDKFAELKKELFVYYLLFSVYWATAFFIPSSFVKSISPKGGFHYYPDAGWLYYAFPLIFFYLLIRGLVILYQSYKQVSSIKRNQYKYFLVFSLLGLGGGATTFFLAFDIPIYPYGAILVPIYNLMVAYIIVKHQLMDIRVVIRKSVIYTLLISLLTTAYVSAVYLLERTFSHALGYSSIIGSVVAFVVLTIILVPLKSFIQSFVDKFFFKASYLQVVEENQLLRDEVLRGERYKTLADLSHQIIVEIRAPLTTMMEYRDKLDKHLNEPEFLQKFSQVFGKEIGGIQALVNRLAEFSESKPLNLRFANIVLLIDEALSLMQPHFQEKKIILYKFYDSKTEKMVNIDDQQMRQVLGYILAASARSILDDGGQIWIGIEESKGFLEIRIKDTGQGFSKEALIRVFDPVLNLKGAEGGGMLFRAQSIISNHGGKIIVDSQVGEGTEWIIQLPGLIR